MKLQLLDTNIVSELRRQERMNAGVKEWFAGVSPNELFLSVMTVGEIRKGIEERRLSDPAQAAHLDEWMTRVLGLFHAHILAITRRIADRWGRLCPGQRLPDVDGYLAATALEHGLTVVTRNTRDFERSGVPVLNPFT